MLLLPNLPEFVFAFLGASYRGASNTTVNPFYTLSEIAKQANDSNAATGLLSETVGYIVSFPHFLIKTNNSSGQSSLRSENSEAELYGHGGQDDKDPKQR
uniref:AMP-dependent synthetase/ligase domain-containing protein n=1 Tax=Nelumbo nucifera TaxID=4432 RepID=A0A822XG03_NELNU|nr:TPA_asm: hypothetical protein HUJ06_019392 [Nelumbo nucifera]